jgi:protein-S-isoprenylcysteine O-methyltransferase Ste14
MDQQTHAPETPDLGPYIPERSASVPLVQATASVGWGAAVVSIIVSLGFFGIMFGLFFVRSEMPQSVFQLLSVMMGILATAFGSVVQYWTGSSDSSRRNGDAIREVARSATIPGPAQVAATVAQAVKR